MAKKCVVLVVAAFRCGRLMMMELLAMVRMLLCHFDEFHLFFQPNIV
jgi:hypothetical protein